MCVTCLTYTPLQTVADDITARDKLSQPGRCAY